MTRAEFIEKHKHRLAGFVLDGCVAGRTGGELALWLRMTMMQIDAMIGAMHDDLIPNKPLPTPSAGPAATPKAK